MNADTDIFSKDLNCWTLTDIKTDNQLFEKEINGQLKWDSNGKPLRCVVCQLEFFCKIQYSTHHLQHIEQPSVLLSPIKRKQLKRLLAGKSVTKQVGPKSKTQGFVPQNRSPLKLTLKRLSTNHKPVFEVVTKKEKIECVEMDDMLPDGSGVTPSYTQSPSPTPSEILRQEVNAERTPWESLAYSFGFLAPETLEGAVGQEAEGVPAVNGKPQEDDTRTSREEDTQSMEPSEVSEAAEPLPSLPEQMAPATDTPVQNGVSDSEPDAPKNSEQESSDSGCEKDGSEKDFSGFETNPTPPPFNLPKGLTILAPSAVNSTVVNGALPPEPLDNSALLEALSEPASPHVSTPPLPTPVKEGLIIKSAESLGVTSSGVNLLNINTNGDDPLGLLRSYVEEPDYLETCDVCGDRSGNLEQHRATMGHYKCRMVPDCRAGVFQTASDLNNHQRTEHGISPPVPPTQPSLEQLQQQVQRLPVPYGMPLPVPGMSTLPPAVSPGFRIPGGITLTYPTGAPSQPGPSTTPPVTGTIQARPFAMATSPSTMRADGSPVSSPTLPAGLSRSISISTKPAQKRATPPSPAVDNAKRSRSDSPDCELVDVQQPLPNLPSSISLTVRGANGASAPVRGGESSGVANILASRGITVTPAVNKSPAAPSSRGNSSQPLTTLNLSSAVSIVPASQSRSQFAVPQNRGRQAAQQVTTTVDLTQDSTPSFRRNRPQRFTCQVCDKVFSTQETLSQHLATHRSPGKLPFKCTLCNAQYPNQQGLLQHKQTYHKEAQGSEMALPVVDLKHPATMQKLNSLGIRHCLIMSQLGNSSGGVFGIPIVAIDNARNPAVCNLGALGACNVLSLGPAKALR